MYLMKVQCALLIVKNDYILLPGRLGQGPSQLLQNDLDKVKETEKP